MREQIRPFTKTASRASLPWERCRVPLKPRFLDASNHASTFFTQRMGVHEHLRNPTPAMIVSQHKKAVWGVFCPQFGVPPPNIVNFGAHAGVAKSRTNHYYLHYLRWTKESTRLYSYLPSYMALAFWDRNGSCGYKWVKLKAKTLVMVVAT